MASKTAPTTGKASIWWEASRQGDPAAALDAPSTVRTSPAVCASTTDAICAEGLVWEASRCVQHEAARA